VLAITRVNAGLLNNSSKGLVLCLERDLTLVELVVIWQRAPIIGLTRFFCFRFWSNAKNEKTHYEIVIKKALETNISRAPTHTFSTAVAVSNLKYLLPGFNSF
jgi:hypothetical protein